MTLLTPLRALASVAIGAAVAIAYALGNHSGYERAKLELERTRHTYTDVSILVRHDAKHFTLQPARMTPFEVTTCDAVDWEPHQKMRILTYQQRYGCKDVGSGGAYLFYVRGDGSRERFSVAGDPEPVSDIEKEIAHARSRRSSIHSGGE